MPFLTWVLLGIALAQPAPAQPAPTREVTVVLAPQSQQLAVASVKIVAASKGEAELTVPVARAGGTARFDLPVSTVWRVSCESSDFWCPEVEVPAEESARRIELPIAKRALLQGEVRAIHPAELPATLQVQAWAYLPNASEPIDFHLSTPVEEGRYELSVPAVRLDVRLTSVGFSPIYLWDLAAQGKAVLDLGTTTLKPGNSLCGFVQDEATGLPLELAEVMLRVPLPPVGSPTQSVERLRRMTWTTQTNSRGFYQIVGPPDGNYQLEVKSAEPEHQPLVVDSVGILADSETCLEDLAVSRAIEVSFTISPALDPKASPWQLQLKPRASGGFVEPTSAVQLDDVGQAKFRVAPGVHDLIVSSTEMGLKILKRSFDLEVPTDIPLTLDLIRVEGSVRLGEEPLVALIDLHDGAQTTFESDYEGFFSGWLLAPPDQRLIVEVSAAYPAFSRWLELEDLEIEDGVLLLDLTFEDRVLEGSVTDEKGNPVRQAEVSAMPVGSRMSIKSTTKADGSFRLIGLAEKPHFVWAKAENSGVSEKARIDPWGDGPGPQLTLVLRRGRPFYGRLTSAELVPVPGARVVFLGGSTGRSSSTGMDGRFEFQVLEGTRRAVAQVFAISHAHWSACVDLPHDDAELSLRLPPLPGGRIVVRVPGTERLGPKHSLVVISADGGFFSLTQIVNWGYPASARHNIDVGSKEEGWTYEFPNLASGRYAVILNSMVDLVAQSCSGAFNAVDWQYLPPGGELSLTVRAAASSTKFGDQ